MIPYPKIPRTSTASDGTNSRNTGGGEKTKPEECDYLQYFDYLHNEREMKASTLWSVPSFGRLGKLNKVKYKK